MLDDSGLSLAVSDPNASLDQYDDGGSSFDYSGLVNSVGQWGTEIASAVTGNQPAPIVSSAGAIGYTGAPLKAPMSSSTKLLIGALIVAGVVIAIKQLG